MLRAVRLGISVADLELITLGELFDMFAELERDQQQEDSDTRMATQADFDNF